MWLAGADRTHFSRTGGSGGGEEAVTSSLGARAPPQASLW